MTEDKRFGVIPNWCVYEKIDEVEKYLTFDETVTILNQLNDENEQLKLQNQRLDIDIKNNQLAYYDLEKENEQLKDALNQRTEQCDKYYEENEQLKQLNRNLGDFRNFITEKNVSNEKQRKELQLQMLRLYNYFENYFEDAMGLTAFSEMWDNVKEDEKWEKRRF